MNSIANIIQTIAVYAIPVLFAITVHEAAHGWTANRLGDNTAAMLGRVTLNPLKHIDPVGTIAIPLMFVLMALLNTGQVGFLFGYAKPVPVRFNCLRNPKRDMIWVALAGPVSNLAQALLWGVLSVLLLPLNGAGVLANFFSSMCGIGVGVNLMLFALNLFPLPPLDGGRVLVGLLPRSAAISVSRIEPWGIWIVVALLVTHVIDWLWLQPLMTFTRWVLNLLLYPLFALVR